VLRLAANRLGEKGEWNLDELKIEFEELILADAPIEITGFTLDEIDQIVLGEADDGVEQGPLAPEADAIAVARYCRSNAGRNNSQCVTEPGDGFRFTSVTDAALMRLRPGVTLHGQRGRGRAFPFQAKLAGSG
jgi:hypothetical protein